MSTDDHRPPPADDEAGRPARREWPCRLCTRDLAPPRVGFLVSVTPLASPRDAVARAGRVPASAIVVCRECAAPALAMVAQSRDGG